MTTQLAPVPLFKGWDNNGNQLSGGQLFTYAAGSSTPQATWTDSTQITQNTNPVILNARGEASVWLDVNLGYKLVLKDSSGNQIWAIDNVSDTAGGSVFSADVFTTSAGQSAYTLSNAPVSSNAVTASLDGAVLISVDDFTIVGTTFTLNVAPLAGQRLRVAYTANIGSLTVPNGTVTDASLAIGSIVGSIVNVYARTAAEIAAAVTPVNFGYPPGYPERYGNNTTPGTTDMTAAVQAAINVGRKAGIPVYIGTSGTCLVTSPLDCTSSTGTSNQGWRMVAVGNMFPQPSPPFLGVIHARHTGYTIFDCSGSFKISWEGISVSSDSVTFPKTCWFIARNSLGSSMFHAFSNTFVVGYFSVAVLYNYGLEDCDYIANRWYNYATTAGACCVVITTGNYFKGSTNFIQSSFITNFTGIASTIGHNFVGGEYALANTSATGDVFYLEGSVANFRSYGSWMMNSAISGGGPNGRSFIYNDTANGNCIFCTISGLKTENSTTLPLYGVFFGTVAATPVSFSLRDSLINVTTYTMTASASVTGADFTIQSVSEVNTRGLNWPGQMQDSFIDFLSQITIGTSLRNFIRTFNSLITITTNTNSTIVDSLTGSFYAKTSLGMGGATGATQLAGWGTPTNGAVINNFAGSSATLAQCGNAITEIIIQLKALGLFGV